MTFQYSTVESTWTLTRVVEDNIGAVALSLRTKVLRWLQLRQQSGKKAGDPEANVSTEEATPATTCDEYVKLCEKPEKVNVIVIKFIRGKWVYFHRFKPDKPPVANTPMFLYLKDGHFTTLDPDETDDPQCSWKILFWRR